MKNEKTLPLDADTRDLIDELKAKDEVLSIAIFGSYARGEARPNSDIDVLVIIKKGVRRDVETRGKRTFEFVYASFPEAMKFYKSNPNDCVQLWKDAVVLYDKKGYMRKLDAFAKRLQKKGKEPLSEDKLKHFRFDAEDAIRAMKAIAPTDPATADLYAHIKAANLIELYFDVRRLWTPPPKKQLTAIRRFSKKDAKVFDAFFTTSDLSDRLNLLSKMVKVTFG